MPKRIEITEAYLQSLISPEPMSGCWLWMGSAINKKGYGYIRADQKSQQAHRVVYKFYVCDPGNNLVLHKCDNPSCVNPEHLFLGTVLDNNRDRHQKGRDAKGLKNGRAKLSDEQVEYIKTSDLKSAVLASMFGCTSEHIRRVQRGVRK